ncbi:eukaryotic long-chain fatty acid CoA synthetase (LC-FACS) [Dipodascopsis uninucleata]
MPVNRYEPGPEDLLVAPVDKDQFINDKDSVEVVVCAPGEKQGVALEGTERPGHTPIYRNAKTVDKLMQSSHPLIRSQYDTFEASVKQFGHKDFLGARYLVDKNQDIWSSYVWQTYATVAERRNNIGAGLCYLNETLVEHPKKDQYAITLFSLNRPEWVISDLACHAYNLIVVPLYDSLGPSSSEYILNSVESPILVASLNHIPKILSLRSEFKYLKAIISMDELESENDLPNQSKGDILRVWAANKGIKLYSFSELEKIGEENPRPHNPPKPSDILTINYTSGTTSDPKGVVLTHANFVAALGTAFCHVPRFNNDVSDLVLSYLPLAHIYERATMGIAMASGAAVAFYRGSIPKILDDLKATRPTVFTSVPRMLNRFESSIRDKTTNAVGFRANIAKKGLQTKLTGIEQCNTVNHPIWDFLVSRKIKAGAGMDRTASIISGSAPLSADTHQFLRAAFGIPVIQGYGLTETHGGCIIGQPNDLSTGNNGPPTVSTEIRLRDVPELDYYTTDKPYPRGELLIRGCMLFREYFKDDEKTKEAFDDEGFFKTGDVGMIDDLGRVYIIDRVKNFFKLSQGEYVAAEKIENSYLSGCPKLQQIFVYGNSLESYLVAIGGIEPQVFAPFASKILERDIKWTDEEALKVACTDPLIRSAILRELEIVAKEQSLLGYEKVKNIRLYVNPFTTDNDLLTPTFKLKRGAAGKAYKEVLDEMYRGGDSFRT